MQYRFTAFRHAWGILFGGLAMLFWLCSASGQAVAQQAHINTPDTGAAVEITTTAAAHTTASSTVSGGTITGATVSAYGICWSSAENPTIADSKNSYDGSTDSFSCVAGPLDADTTYYIRAYAVAGGETYYGAQISVTTSELSGTNSVILHNPANGKVIWWKINEDSKLVSSTEGSGWGLVSEDTGMTDGWRIVGSLEFTYARLLLWHDQENGGTVHWWRLNNQTNSVNPNASGEGVVSETMELGPDWKLGGMCKLVDNALIWHDRSSGSVVWWKVLSDGFLLSEKQGLGWDYVSSESVSSNWNLVAALDRNDEHVLFWHSETDGKVAWWKLDDSGSGIDDTRGSGWGFVSENVRVPGAWTLVEVVEDDALPVLIWHNQNNGKVVWWRLSNANKLIDENQDGGWGFVSQNVTVSGNWKLFKVLQQDTQKTLLWQNENNGRMVWWKVNSSWTLRSEEQEDGWGFVADYSDPSGYIADQVFE